MPTIKNIRKCPICSINLISDDRNSRRYCDTREKDNPRCKVGHYYVEKLKNKKIYSCIYYDYDFVMQTDMVGKTTWINGAWSAGKDGVTLDYLVDFNSETRIFLENFFVVK